MIAIALGNGGIADDSSARDDLRQALIDYLPGQRWFAAKDRAIADLRLVWCGEFADSGARYSPGGVEVEPGPRRRAALPAAARRRLGDGDRSRGAGGAVARVSRAGKTGVLYDAALVRRAS